MSCIRNCINDFVGISNVDSRLQQHIDNDNVHITEEERKKLSELVNKEDNITDESSIIISLKNKADKTEIPTKVSQLINDKGYITTIPDYYITEAELAIKDYLPTADYRKQILEVINSQDITLVDYYTKEEINVNLMPLYQSIEEVKRFISNINNINNLNHYYTKDEVDNQIDEVETQIVNNVITDTQVTINTIEANQIPSASANLTNGILTIILNIPKGQKGDPGQNGQDGQDGKNGADGKDAIAQISDADWQRINTLVTNAVNTALNTESITFTGLESTVSMNANGLTMTGTGAGINIDTNADCRFGNSAFISCEDGSIHTNSYINTDSITSDRVFGNEYYYKDTDNTYSVGYTGNVTTSSTTTGAGIKINTQLVFKNGILADIIETRG